MSRDLYCSFCGKSQHDVRKLIAGPGDTFICDECVVLCNDIIATAPADKAEVPMAERSTADQLAALHKAVADLAKALQEVMARARDEGEVHHLIEQRVRGFALRPQAPSPKRAEP